jgi:flagellar biosynthesis/type III secretory pathway protein FliH
LFNPMPQRAAPQAWTPNAVIQPQRTGVKGFETTDWENVPRLDYRTEKFRQLAVPDPARVVDDASEFEPWQPKQLEAKVSNAVSGAATESQAVTHPSIDSTMDGAAGPADHEGAMPVDAGELTPQEARDNAHQTHEADDSTSADGDPSTPDEFEASQNSSAHDSVDDDAKAGSSHEGRQARDERDASPSGADADPGASPTLNDAASEHPGGLDSAAVQAACDEARREGHDQGLAAGRAEALAQAQADAQEALQAAREQAQADQTQALQALREELEGELAPLKRQLSKAVEQVESLIAQPDKLYEHIKRLSLHLAEQLVLGELNMSSAAIERLIQRCLDELDLHGHHVVTVELNPQDKARLQERAGELTHALSLLAVPALQPGSVRVVVNDTMVEDLVGNRLDALARSLLVQPEVWREQSPFFRQPLSQRDSDVQDASTRPVASREAALRESVVREPKPHAAREVTPDAVEESATSLEPHPNIALADATEVPDHVDTLEPAPSDDRSDLREPGGEHHD